MRRLLNHAPLTWHAVGVLVAVAWPATVVGACGGTASGTRCGEGTVLQGSDCVPAPSQPDGGDAATTPDDGAPAPDVTGDATTEGDAHESPGDADAEGSEADAKLPCTDTCGNPGCGDCPMKAMVTIAWAGDWTGDTTYEIDSTETTQAEYEAFLEASYAPPDDSPCAGYSSFQADPATFGSGMMGKGADLPQYSVNYCDAWSYCAWAGKRLCGDMGPFPTGLICSDDDWVQACTGDCLGSYPYGKDFEPGRCNVVFDTTGTYEPVGSRPTCEGGYPGLFDLIGNVWEWGENGVMGNFFVGVFDPTNPDPSLLSCVVAGGANEDLQDKNPLYGIRCCR